MGLGLSVRDEDVRDRGVRDKDVRIRVRARD